jgi:hypothetical protein
VGEGGHSNATLPRRTFRLFETTVVGSTKTLPLNFTPSRARLGNISTIDPAKHPPTQGQKGAFVVNEMLSNNVVSPTTYR